MTLILATWFVRAVLLYLAIGLVFAIAFALRGAGRIDPVAAESTVGFRLLVIPGATALWPWLLARWLSGRTTPPDEVNAHRTATRRGRS